jgi:hypothetical protein
MRIKNSIKFKLSRGRRGRRGTRRIRKRTRQIRRLRRPRLTRRIRQGSRQYMHDGGMFDITSMGKSAFDMAKTSGSKLTGTLGTLTGTFAGTQDALSSVYTTGSKGLSSVYNTGSNVAGRLKTAAKDAAYTAVTASSV